MSISVSGIAQSVLDYINGWPQRPADARLGELGEGLPALRLLPLAGAAVLRRYADGTEVISWPFSVSLRTRPTSEAGSAIELLSELADYMSSAELPYLGSDRCALAVELCGAPERSSADISGFVSYSVPFRLIFAAAPRCG